MNRTPLMERQLPDYTTGEEIANTLTHSIGAAAGIAIAVAAILTAARHANTYGIVSAAIYGFTLIALFTMSSVYHGLRSPMPKKVMQVIDHCTIYFLIAGTYTPILLSAIRPSHPALAWTVFGIEWGLCFTAATLTAIDLKKYNTLSMICYIGMGWLIILAVKPTVAALSGRGFALLLGGGLAYTAGAVLYVIGAHRHYFHSVFHVFVNLGAALQALSIICFAL